MSSPGPKSPELSDKNKKYDRQIRLWGEHGQSQLESAQVCLINVTALGTEILKGIVLPGIGGFTIIDGGVVTEEDVGCNFFLDLNCVGLSRAKSCMQLLQELNPDVSGDYVDENVETVLQNNPEFLSKFNVVIASSIREKTIILLSDILWNLNIPFFLCHSVGFMATVRLQLKELCIVEMHPDNKHTDLRLEQPFSTLDEYLKKQELNHKVPWLFVLYKYLEIWRGKSNKRIPTTYKEKCELKELIRNGMAKDEENYEEAIKAVNSCFCGGKPSERLLKILNDGECTSLKKTSKNFWILARALKDFIANEGNGWLPVPGSIPDMTAETICYINLQNIYRAQARNDADIVYNNVEQLLRELNLSSDYVTDSDVKLFCREAAYIDIVRGSKIADEYEKSPRTNVIAMEMETPNSLMGLYVLMRAMDRFQSEHGSVPGESHVEMDTPRIKYIAGKLLSEWGISTPLCDDLAHELCRCGGAEVHTISAFMGGCVAHEIIKIITKQYKPINNTFVYNGITSETATYEL